MDKWNTILLSEATTLIKRGVSPKYVEDDGYRVINQKCIRDNYLSLEPSRLTSKLKKVSEEKFIVSGDVLVNSTGTGTLGRTAPVKKLNSLTTVDSHVTIVRPNKQVVEPSFVAYLMAYNEPIITDLGKGATNQIELSARDLGRLKIKIPESIKSQKKIASILSAYDNLIENNLKRIKLLEEKAQLTYEEWFVRMKYPGHENDVVDSETGLPEGWVKKSLKEEINQFINGGWGKEEIIGKNTIPAYVIRGTDISKLKGGDITSLPLRYHTESNLKSRTLQKGDIILEMSNGNIKNVGRNYFFDNTLDTDSKSIFLCASFCKMIRPSSYSLSIIIYCHLQYIYNNDSIGVYRKQASNGINNFDFDKMITDEEINLPLEKVFFDFSAKLESIQNTISKIRAQIGKLKSARDILLPRLMSGMIDIDEIKYNYPKEISA